MATNYLMDALAKLQGKEEESLQEVCMDKNVNNSYLINFIHSA